jgi:hypothetical protein
VQRLQRDGITAANVATRQVEAYTTPLVRVDHTGRLQVILLVTTVDEQVQLRLAQYQVRIDMADPALRLLYAWVPFDRLQEIATLPFVRYVRPAGYVVKH